MVEAFKYARLFDPVNICESKPSCKDLDQLKVLPSLSFDYLLDESNSELPI